jgi:hypothetical protein
MKNEIKKIKDLKGKTISDLKLDGDLWLKFTDGTFAVLVVNDITEGFGYTRNEVNIYKYGKDKTEETLVDLGIITKKEHEQAIREREIEYKKREDERIAEREESIRKSELEQFKKIKSKYGL